MWWAMWICLMAVSAGSAVAQTAGHAAAVAGRGGEAATAPVCDAGPGCAALREIEDPATGALWLLFRDAAHPGGPGRLVLASGPGTGRTARVLPAGERPVIRTGDALVVEEHTAVVDARLEAVALGPAAKGASLRARLKIGGNVVRVVAVAPGHAVFAPESEAER